MAVRRLAELQFSPGSSPSTVENLNRREIVKIPRRGRALSLRCSGARRSGAAADCRKRRVLGRSLPADSSARPKFISETHNRQLDSRCPGH
jgi:hypothetical protein